MPSPWAAGAQVRVIGEMHGQTTINVLNFATNTVVNDDPNGLALLKALAMAVKECVENNLLPAVTSDWKLVRTDAKKISPTVGDAIDSDAPNSTDGTLSPTSVSFSASLMRISTGGGGRSGRGRLFLPPPGEAEIASSDIDGPTMILIAQFLACVAAKFIGGAATTPWRFGVLSRKKVDNVLPSFDNRFREAVSLSASPVVSCIRSRKKGHGV